MGSSNSTSYTERSQIDLESEALHLFSFKTPILYENYS